MLCYAPMELLLHFVLLAAGVAILVKSADWFTDAAVEVARRLRIPEIVVGATIVSLATTLPEFAVSFTAVIQNHVEMAVGNAVGSTICNVGLILGVCALLSPMGVERRGFLNSGLGLLALAGIFGALGYVFPEGSRWTGLVMVSCLGVYLVSVVRSSMKYRATSTEAEDAAEAMGTGRIVALFAVGAVGVVLGSKMMVHAAEQLALLMGVSKLIIGLTVVAVGTSTPELVVSLAAIAKKRRGLSIGNIIGANILNLAWVIGACSLVRPLPLVRQTLIFDIPVMLFLSVLLLLFGLTGSRLSRWEGGVLFAIYLAYLTTVFTVFRTAAA